MSGPRSRERRPPARASRSRPAFARHGAISWVKPAFESRYPTRRSELVVGGIAGVDGESSAGVVLTPLKGSSQRSVQFWSVFMANKSSIVSDLHGWRTPSVSGEELQAPGKSGPQ